MRRVLVVLVISACGHGGHLPPDADADVGLVRVTAYGRCSGGPWTRPRVLAVGVEIRSYSAAGNAFASALTDADGVAMLQVPAGGSILYSPCPNSYESILDVAPGDDLIVGAPREPSSGGPNPPACSTGTGTMTIMFPTVANATSYSVNGQGAPSPTFMIGGCNGAQIAVLAQAFDSSRQLVGYQVQTITIVDQSTLQLDTLLPPSTLDMTVNPPLTTAPWLDESAIMYGGTVTTFTGSAQSDGSYRFAYAKFAPTCTIAWNTPQQGGVGASSAEITIPTDQTSLSVDVPQLMQLPYTATRIIGAVVNAAPTGDLQIFYEYMIDAPPGHSLSPADLPVDMPAPTAQVMPANWYETIAIHDAQYDDYGDFRNQRRHLDRPVQRSVVTSGGNLPDCGYDCWPTSR